MTGIAYCLTVQDIILIILKYILYTFLLVQQRRIYQIEWSGGGQTRRILNFDPPVDYQLVLTEQFSCSLYQICAVKLFATVLLCRILV